MPVIDVLSASACKKFDLDQIGAVARTHTDAGRIHSEDRKLPLTIVASAITWAGASAFEMAGQISGLKVSLASDEGLDHGERRDLECRRREPVEQRFCNLASHRETDLAAQCAQHLRLPGGAKESSR